MSLVSDALRKAQVETAQRDRLQHRFYLTHGGRTSAARPRASRAAVIVSAIFGGCITAGLLLVYLGRMLPTYASLDAQSPAPAIAATPAPVQAAAAPQVPDERAAVEEKPRVTRRKPVVEPKAVEAAAVSVPAETPAPKRRTSRDSFVAGETYVSPIRGPMGIEVALSGISSARGDSVAIINGTLMRRGGVIGPFLIEDIEPRRVRVRYVDVSFWLTY